jgi:hypothetical protein
LFQTVEAAGIEPASSSDVTNNSKISCDNTTDHRAAPALHFGDNASQDVSPSDPALQAVIEAWPRLPTPLRKAILGIVRSQEDGMSNHRVLT